MSPKADQGTLTIKKLEPRHLEVGPQPEVTTTNLPIREDVRQTVAAVLSQAIAHGNRGTA